MEVVEGSCDLIECTQPVVLAVYALEERIAIKTPDDLVIFKVSGCVMLTSTAVVLLEKS